MTSPDREALLDRYDGIVTDLDGVVYRGDQAVPGVAEALREVRRRRVPLVFLTNNSARTPEEVAERLGGMGVDANPSEILTSALAAASMLRREGCRGMSAFVVGERGIVEALASVGVRVVNGPGKASGNSPAERTDLVVVGWDRSADYDKLRTAGLLVQRGARLVATNADSSYPAPDGLWPGAGALLAAVTATTGARAAVAGKPERPMFDLAAEMAGADRPLMVGDRLDTDIGGGAGAGWDTLLVRTGASRIDELLRAPAMPTYLAPDLTAVLEPRVPARFRRAVGRADMAAVHRLLAASGLTAHGPSERGTRTVMCAFEPQGRSTADAGHASKRPGAAATASLVPLDSSDGQGGSGPRGAVYLRSVAVDPRARGQGLGLLAAAAAIRLAASTTGHTDRRRSHADRLPPGPPGPVFLLTEDAAGLFQRLGFRRIAAADLPSAVATIADRQGCAASATAMVLGDGP